MLQRVASLLRATPPITDDRGLLSSSGATVPTDGTDGYQPSCFFQDTTNGVMYVNEGSVTSCDFNALGDLTSVDYSAGGTTAITISGTYTVEGILIQRSCTRGLRVGEFASSGVATSAMILDATTPTAVEIHGGLSADPGSGTMARPLRSRFIIASVGNVEAETYGMQGQLVVKSSNLGHWHGGVLGTIECQTALSVYNPLAGVGALVGRIGGSTITVQSSCYLAGVIALASAVGVSNSGVYAGLYATKTSGASNFSHGVYIENSDVGIALVGAMTTGIDFTAATFVMDANRTNSAIAIGDRLGAKTITFAAAVNHFDPIQINLLTAGTNPTDGSTVNGIYQLITHSTAMTSLRLKCADWNIAVSKNVKDVYVYQGEVLFSGSGVTVGGEAAVLGLVMNAGASAVTGNLRGLIISMQGAGFPANGIGIELRSTATTLAEGIRISGTPLITVGIAMGNQANDNEGPTHAFFFPSGPGADVGPVVQSADSGAGDGSIKIKIGSSTKYLQYWDSAT